MKKDGVVTTAAKGSAPKDETVMIVSGRNVYDAFGRVAVRCQTKSAQLQMLLFTLIFFLIYIIGLII